MLNFILIETPLCLAIGYGIRVYVREAFKNAAEQGDQS